MWLPEDLPDLSPLRADPRLPCDAPFHARDAERVGVGDRVLRRLVRDGLLRRVFPTVYVDVAAPDTLDLRARALALVLPPDAVATDRTAAWLHGVDVVAPGDHLVPAPLDVFARPGRARLRKSGTASGERTLSHGDVERVQGVPVTTPLRTALDLGRLLPRDQALAALDGLLRTERFGLGHLMGSTERFKGMRGVVQLRALGPLADPRAESPGESALRLRWLDAGLPRVEPQVPVLGRFGQPWAYVDLANAELRLGAEYDGRDWHTSPAQREHDRRRRERLRTEHGWTLLVFTKQDVFGRDRDVVGRRLHAALRGLERRPGA